MALKARAQESEAERLSPTLGAGQAARLSPDTAAFRAELARIGIEAVPVCELADVSDPAWGPAIEGLLGRAREALVVPPDQLEDA
ncbi:hypothetical protein, partial [Klebsiella aerogenes]|uniref:hypothetical protein n=1 Tax=Klebsiella aerogenes TaxID=548 RepID=UPI0019533408